MPRSGGGLVRETADEVVSRLQLLHGLAPVHVPGQELKCLGDHRERNVGLEPEIEEAVVLGREEVSQLSIVLRDDDGRAFRYTPLRTSSGQLT